MNEVIFEIVGWLGALLILGGYALLVTGKVTRASVVYHLVNLTGAVGIILNAAFHGSWPPVVLNVLWASIATFGIVSIAVGRRRTGDLSETIE